MSLKDVFRLQDKSEFIGTPDLFTKIDKALRENRPILVTGPPGTGKTSLAYLIAKEYNLTIYEWNASDKRRKGDLEKVLRLVRMRSFDRPLYFFDEIDSISAWSIFEQILRECRYPIFMAANERRKIPQSIASRCLDIQLWKPHLQAVSKRIQFVASKSGVTPSFSSMSQDIRHSLITAFYGGESYSRDDIFQKVTAIFHGRYNSDMDVDVKDVIIWLIDNASQFYYGKNLYDFIQLLCKIDQTGEINLLRYVPKCTYGKVSYPYYFRRLAVLKGKNNGI